MSEPQAIPDPRPFYARAAEQFAALITATEPDRLDLPTPCAEYDVRSLLGHVVAGTERIAGVGEGKAPEGPDVPPWAAELPVAEWPQRYAEARARMTSAWADDAKLDEQVTVPWGRMPGRIALAGAVMETVTHCWDLARAIGREDVLDPELAEFALVPARQALPAEGREHRPFGDPYDVPEDAGPYLRLAGWLGRAPEWPRA